MVYKCQNALPVQCSEILTLARKFEAVHSTTVMSRSIMPTVCLHLCDLLPQDQAISVFVSELLEDGVDVDMIPSEPSKDPDDRAFDIAATFVSRLSPEAD